MAKNLEKIRNIGIFAHIDAGKTTLSERILYYAGKIHKMGEVHEGTTTLDYLEEEKERGITITAACTQFEWNKNAINLIDTPGHIDFTVEVERSMRVIDGAVILFCGVGGVQPQTEVIWHQTELFGVPKIGFINKLDRVGADIKRVLNEIKNKFEIDTALLQIPIGSEKNFKGIIDIIEKKIYIWNLESKNFDGTQYEVRELSPEYSEIWEKYYGELLEVISIYDEELLEDYLNNKEIPAEKIKKVIKREVLNKNFFPVFCGSALKKIGIQPLLSAIVDYLPSPRDIKFVEGYDVKKDKECKIELTKEGPFCGLVFKIVSDIHKGKLAYIRIYRGSVKIGDSVLNVNVNKSERIQKIFLMHANKEELLEKAEAGDIVALVGPKFTFTGHTLADRKHPVLLEEIPFLEPVISITIEPETTFEKKKLDKVLKRLTEEDPTIKVSYDEQTDQIILSGMGELQLEVLINRIKHDFNINVKAGTPQVNYKETIRKPIELEEELQQQIGNNIYWAKLKLALEPIKKEENEIQNTLPETFPTHIKESLQRELQLLLSTGPYQGYPITNLRCIIKDGIYDQEKSNEIVFKSLLHNLFKKGYMQADPYLLEPIMEVEITTPAEYVGNIISDLNSRNANVSEIKDMGILKFVLAMVPLKEMFGYITTLRSLSQGRANFVMRFSHYAPVEENK